MGFGKQKIDDDAEESTTGLFKKKKFGKSNSQQLELKFTPSTNKEVKSYARKAAEQDAAKKEAKLTRPERIKLDLDRNLPFDFKRPNALRRVWKEILIERRKRYLADKSKQKRWAPKAPRYEIFEKQKYADSNFVYDVQTTIANFTWSELTKLINTAAGAEIPTKDYSEAFRTAQAVMHQALGVELDSSGTRYRLMDRDEVLEKWFIEIIERKRKMPKNDDDEKVKKITARAKDDDEEEEVEESEEEESEDDADEPEEESEDEEDEAPKKAKKKTAKKAVKKIPKDEPDDEDEEEEEEEPEEDEEESEDDEDDGDDEPKPVKKGKKTVATKKAVKKVAKKAVKEEKPKRAAKPAATAVKLKDTTIIKRTTKTRDRTGPKTDLIELVSKKGTAYSKILAAAEKAEMSMDRVKKWIPMMIGNGYLSVE